jgi:hypothetical protein
MARNQTTRLNFLGVLSILIGITAFVATKFPIAGYGPIPIAALGIGVGVLAFLISVMFRRSGSGVPVLGVLVSLGAMALVGYTNGTLSGWWAKIHPTPPPAPKVIAPPAPNVVAPPAPAGPSASSDQPREHNIFEDGTSAGPRSNAPASPAPALNHTPAVAAPVPAPPAVPVIPQVPVPTVLESRAKLDAATAAVERGLAADPAYMQARADVAAADEKRKAALADSGPGSPAVQEASSQWLDAKGRLKKVVAAAAAKDPAVLAAQRQMNDAEANVRKGAR